MYWIVLFLIIPIFFIVPSFGAGHERDPATILSSISLIGIGDPNGDTVLAVAWTLYHEILFYALFGISILNIRIGTVVIGAWLLASVASLAFGPFTEVIGFYFSPMHLLFGMGMAVAWLLRHARIPAPATLAACGTVLFLAVGMEDSYLHEMHPEIRSLLYGLGSSLALIGFVVLERQGRVRAPRLMRLIGDASYSIYLTHFPVLSLLAKIMMAAGLKTALPATVSYLLMVLAAVGAGIAAHLLVERPLLALLAGRRRAITRPLTP